MRPGPQFNCFRQFRLVGIVRRQIAQRRIRQHTHRAVRIPIGNQWAMPVYFVPTHVHGRKNKSIAEQTIRLFSNLLRRLLRLFFFGGRRVCVVECRLQRLLYFGARCGWAVEQQLPFLGPKLDIPAPSACRKD